jgi:hypothetical protein
MYYIYHIEGIKIGCSVNPDKRVRAQGYSEYKILEKHSDIDIASKREIELQDEYGLTEKYSKTDYKTFIKNRFSFKKGNTIGFKVGDEPWNKGTSPTLKTKLKISLANTGRVQTDEEKEKRRNSALKINTTDEYRKQQSERIKEWWKLRKLNLL